MQNEERGTEVTVPHLAESLVSATVGKWLKLPGDYVQEYEVLCELITEKVNVEMPAPLEGTMIRIFVQEGQSAEVGAPLCMIQEPEESHKPGAAESSKHDAVSENKVPAQSHRRYSPAVLHLAEQHQIDLSIIHGTGLGGRITRKDVLASSRNRADIISVAHPEPESLEPERAANKQTASVIRDVDHQIPITPIRNIIASRMRQSVTEIPHAWLMVEADVSNLVALRQKLKDPFMKEEGVRLTFTPFILKAIVNAVKEFPILNSTWSSEHITIRKEIHLSIAVGSEDSVVTPVLRNADRKTIAGLAIELDNLVKRARAGNLTLSDMQGGTFTFNNTGSFGSVLSYPIINYPQAAIMTFESIIRRPVVIQDGIAIRSMANLCLSLDHRILDGMVCGRFMKRVKHYLEQYHPDTVIY